MNLENISFIWLFTLVAALSLSLLFIVYTRPKGSFRFLSIVFFLLSLTELARYLFYQINLFHLTFRHNTVGDTIFVWILFFIALAILSLFYFVFSKKGAKWLCLVGLIVAMIGLNKHYHFYRTTPLPIELRNSLDSSALIATKILSIPGHPDASNPSIVPCEGGYLLSFRTPFYSRQEFKELRKKFKIQRNSAIGLARFNHSLELIEKPYVLDIKSYSDKPSNAAEDGRLIRFGSKYLLLFNDHIFSGADSTYNMYVVELERVGDLFQIQEKAVRLRYEKMMSTTEKNWTPFVYQDKLHLIYSGSPHLILEADLETGICKEVAISTNCFSWKWGSIRGGSPALLVDGAYLTFFHSMRWQKVLGFLQKVRGAYVMGAYLFEGDPPFSVKKMSPSPIGSLVDYTLLNRRKVVFPGGIALSGNQIYVVWGKNDRSIAISIFDKEKLLNSLRSCSVSETK